MITEMIFKFGTWFLELDSKCIKQFPVWEWSINITNHNNISSLIKVRDDIFAFQLAFDF